MRAILIKMLLLLSQIRIVPFSPPIYRMIFLGLKGNYGETRLFNSQFLQKEWLQLIYLMF